METFEQLATCNLVKHDSLRSTENNWSIEKTADASSDDLFLTAHPQQALHFTAFCNKIGPAADVSRSTSMKCDEYCISRIFWLVTLGSSSGTIVTT